MAGIKTFSAKQKRAMTWWTSERYRSCDAVICDGAVRSGKTLCMTIGFFMWATANFRDAQFYLMVIAFYFGTQSSRTSGDEQSAQK